jgi:hypothetical protein
MRQITSSRQDAKTKKELLYSRSLQLKLQHLDNDAIAAKLYSEGLGVEEAGLLKHQYSGAYIGKVVRSALKEVAADRKDYGESLAVILEAELDELLEFWRPLALDPEAPSVKAADLVRKIIQQKAEMCGANAPVLQQIEIKYQNDVENFVNVLRELLDEDTFSKILTAIDQATAMNSAYYQSRQLESGDAIDAQVIE